MSKPGPCPCGQGYDDDGDGDCAYCAPRIVSRGKLPRKITTTQNDHPTEIIDETDHA